MTATFLKDISWAAIIGLALIFAVVCFLAVLWSKREWNTRKIRVGMFLEREYRTDGDKSDEEVTKEWPMRKEE